MFNKELLDGRYKILKTLAKNNTGEVYLAENVKLGTYWAIKRVVKNKGEEFGLLAEPDILKKLSHPALPRIFDILEDDKSIYIIEDYIEGNSLDKELKEKGKFDESTVCEWAKQLCEILIYLHGLKPNPIIYRDMKPSNIILAMDNKIKLVDFGISRQYKNQSADDTIYMGTIGYAAPEQYGKCQTDARSDIFSLGMTLYHLITGIGPNDPSFEAKPLRKIDKNISKSMEYIIDKCIKQDPSLRYQSAREMLYDLQNIERKGINSIFKGIISTNFNNLKENISAKKTNKLNLIAIGGAGSRVGCTHIAIQVAYFLIKQTSNAKVAVLQLNQKSDFQLLKSLSNKKALNENSFRLKKIDFYYDTSFLEIKNSNYYDYCILDIGRLKTDEDGEIKKSCHYDMMSLADIPILVCNSKPWQYREIALTIFKSNIFNMDLNNNYKDYIDNYELIKNWRLLFNLSDNSFYNEIYQFLQKYWRVYKSDYNPELFDIKLSEENVFASILESVL